MNTTFAKILTINLCISNKTDPNKIFPNTIVLELLTVNKLI